MMDGSNAVRARMTPSLFDWFWLGTLCFAAVAEQMQSGRPCEINFCLIIHCIFLCCTEKIIPNPIVPSYFQLLSWRQACDSGFNCYCKYTIIYKLPQWDHMVSFWIKMHRQSWKKTVKERHSKLICSKPSASVFEWCYNKLQEAQLRQL